MSKAATERFGNIYPRTMRHRLVQRRLELDPPLSREALAHAIGVHPKHLARIERGESTPRPATRNKLAKALGWSPAELALALTDEDPEMPLGPAYRVPTTGLDMLAMLEQSCRQLRTLELTIVPGLLQTPAYAAAVESLEPAPPDADEIAQRVGERMARQRRVFDKEDPLRLYALLDPSILRSDVGGPDVMAEQVEHLREMDARPNVSVHLLSEPGRIAVSGGPFKLLTGDDPTPFAVVTDDLATRLVYRDGPTVVGIHHDTWRHIWRVSDALA